MCRAACGAIAARFACAAARRAHGRAGPRGVLARGRGTLRCLLLRPGRGCGLPAEARADRERLSVSYGPTVSSYAYGKRAFHRGVSLPDGRIHPLSVRLGRAYSNVDSNVSFFLYFYRSRSSSPGFTSISS